MYFTVDEVTAAQKAAAQMMFGIASEAVNGVEKLSQLNSRTLHDNAERVAKTLGADAMQPLGAPNGEPSPLERAALYNQQMFDILTRTQSAIVAQISAQYEARVHAVQADIEVAAQRAPAGLEAATSTLNSAISAANAFYESVWKTMRQAANTAGSSLEVVTRSV